MKKFLSSVILMQVIAIASAQQINKTIALAMVERNQQLISPFAENLLGSFVSSAYHDAGSNTDKVYLLQQYKNLPVYNQVLALAFKNGKLVSQAGHFLESVQKKSANISAIPVFSASDAVRTALEDKNLTTALPIFSISSTDTKKLFGKLGIATEDITAELMWVPVNEGKEVKLAWQVYLVPATSADYWMIRVDANTNKKIAESNFTVYCSWDAYDTNHTHHEAEHLFYENIETPKSFFNWQSNSPSLVNTANYRVIPFPAESPIHPGGAPTVVSNPWNLAGGNAVTLGWHSNGTTDYTSSRGNNVWAKEDRDGNNNTTGASAVSTTSPDPLNFDFVPNFTITPIQVSPVQNQQFNITNLFYWNNIIHDLTYNYGFTEVAGNFQSNNLGRGGLGNDAVNADAQDGGGTNNANFSTPSDGSSGRMQMYLWSGSPQKDGDVDNGVVLHEFTHGISNRLTGGPALSGCLQNTEQMGEGWGDYFCIMATQDWANSTLNDGATKPRAIGNYVSGQGVNGGGIRQYKYCTNMSTNPLTYTNVSTAAIPHGIGAVWCTILWDMTWNIIQQTGVINPNIFDANAPGGNSIALKLVMEGMKLQPCSPGFVDGRDAILAADQILYNGAYHCAILQAFARRGVGTDASQGSSDSRSDQIVGFSTVESKLLVTQNVTQQEENAEVVYTNKVTAGSCGNIVNYLLTDTLPSNVTYVSGGTYNSVSRVVSFPVNITSGNSQLYSFTVRINNGTYFPPVNLFEDNVPNSSISSGWQATSTTSTNWVSDNAISYSPPYAYFSGNPDVTSDERLLTTADIALGATPPNLSFWNWFVSESSYDGGVVEISTNGGTSWSDIGASNFITGGYTGIMDGSTLLSGRPAFTGNSYGFKKSVVNLGPYANQNVRFRFRFTTDEGTNLIGWRIDDIAVKKTAVVEITSNLYNAGNKKVNVSDTFTLILPAPTSCTPLTIVNQPSSVTGCVNNSVALSANISGTNPAYQWQVSTTGCAGTFTNIAGATSAILNLNNLSLAQNNEVYRVVAQNSCPSNITSACITLLVNEAAGITSQPVDIALCEGQSATFTTAASTSTVNYQWQLSADGGASWTNIASATNPSLVLNNITAAMNGNQYQALITDNCTNLSTNAATLTVNQPVSINIQPAPASACRGENKQFTVDAQGLSITYQWQMSANNGTTWSNITDDAVYSGTLTNTLSVTGTQLSMNGNLFRAVVTGDPCGSVNSDEVSLTVNPDPVVTLNATNSAINPSLQSVVTALVSPSGNYAYAWLNNNTLVSGANGSSYSATVDNLGSIRAIALNQTTGCTDTSDILGLGALQSTVLFIYPNPSNGIFQVRYFKDPSSAAETRILKIFDSKGAKVFLQQFSITEPYQKMLVDISRYSSGVYLVELIGKDGKRLAVGKVSKHN
ncbi:MAG: M36 family metallopeptidase [Chitinophagaceae bacterium]|nr:M36 family metallopeptidase [Chitinophagaceae bacterium]MBP6046541.1 M36 family metallopeptidase [Ferruginibacter sp.]MBP6988368.1 M36 family metallopeptidase [Ferruginibacter sp.]QQS63956.1 MAG: M36 family metallopeptidase [Chitinophagaceae bacterium]